MRYFILLLCFKLNAQKPELFSPPVGVVIDTISVYSDMVFFDYMPHEYVEDFNLKTESQGIENSVLGLVNHLGYTPEVVNFFGKNRPSMFTVGFGENTYILTKKVVIIRKKNKLIVLLW